MTREDIEMVVAAHDVDVSPSDVVLFVRPAHAGAGHDDEQTMTWSYEQFARWSTHTTIKQFTEIIDGCGEGKYIIGVRNEGDGASSRSEDAVTTAADAADAEQYTQRFMVTQPHAEEQFLQTVENHLYGVLNHWRV